MTSQIIPAILIGGAGTRLWPLSRSNRPKQFLDLLGERSLFQDTVLRFDSREFAAPFLLTNADTVDQALLQLEQLGRHAAGVVVEPSMRGTAAALAALALVVADTDPDALLLAAPADHVIANPGAFLAAVRAAAPIAAAGSIVTFGIKPTAAETGFGYIRGGRDIAIDGLTAGYAIDAGSFLEKPSRANAEIFVAQGYFWNAGIFLAKASTLIREFGRHAPSTLAAAQKAALLAEREVSGATVLHRLDHTAFDAAPGDLSIDNAVMEVTESAAVVPCEDIGWSDVGSLSALWDIASDGSRGNVAYGDGLFIESSGSLIHARGPRKIVAAHMTDVMVIDTEDCVVVLPRDRAQDIKSIVKLLKGQDSPLLSYTRHAASSAASGEMISASIANVAIRPARALASRTIAADRENWVVTAGSLTAAVDGEIVHLAAGQTMSLRRGETLAVMAGEDGATCAVIFTGGSPDLTALLAAAGDLGFAPFEMNSAPMRLMAV